MNLMKKKKKVRLSLLMKKNKNKEIFLEHKRMKTWEDAKSGKKCLMLYARSLYITWGGYDPWLSNSYKEKRSEADNSTSYYITQGANEYWIWNSFKHTSDENIEVARLSHVCRLDVRGKIQISKLSPGTLYEVVYVVKLTKGAFGWELPIRLRLYFPDKTFNERQVLLWHKPRERWMELNVGNFKTEDNEETGETTKEVCFDIYGRGGQWKSGLVIRGAILRPKS